MRAAAVAALNAIEEQAGLAPFIEDEILSTALNVDKPFLRIEVRNAHRRTLEQETPY